MIEDAVYIVDVDGLSPVPQLLDYGTEVGCGLLRTPGGASSSSHAVC